MAETGRVCPPLVSVVVVHLGGLNLLGNFLASLYRSQSIEQVETIVVDNASETPGVEKLVERYSGIRLVRLCDRKGYSAATNAGIGASSGKYILWCNNDLVFAKDAVQMLTGFLESHPDYGVAGPRLLNPDGSYQPSFSMIHIDPLSLILERLCLSALFPSRVIERNSYGHETVEQDVAVVTGACMLIRKEALREIGDELDERFYLYSEEFDLCHSLSKAGWKARYLPSSRVTHFGGQTTTKTGRWRLFMVQRWRSNYAYIRKHYGEWNENVLAGFVIVTAVPRVCFALGRQLAGILMADQDYARLAGEQRHFHSDLLRLSMSVDRHRADVLWELEQSPWRQN